MLKSVFWAFATISQQGKFYEENLLAYKNHGAGYLLIDSELLRETMVKFVRRNMHSYE